MLACKLKGQVTAKSYPVPSRFSYIPLVLNILFTSDVTNEWLLQGDVAMKSYAVLFIPYEYYCEDIPNKQPVRPHECLLGELIYYVDWKFIAVKIIGP